MYWANSQRVAIDNTYKPVDACKADIEKQLLDYQNQAMRTLGFAYQIIEDGQDESFFVNGRLHNTDLTYLGIVAISDPVRADVPAAVQSCLNAGIDVKIVTGDTPVPPVRLAVRSDLETGRYRPQHHHRSGL